MSDTFGPNLFDSFENADPISSSASKSLDEVDSNGSLVSRVCSECLTRKSLQEFYRAKESRKGFLAMCKPCACAKERERKAAIGTEKLAQNFRRWRRENRAKALLVIARFRAKKKGLEFSLDGQAPFIQGVIDAGVCELTGIPFNLDGGKTWDSPSLDRIDSSKGYTPTNVRVVLYCVNVMANLWGENKIVEIADAIVEARRVRSGGLQQRIEASLKRQMDLDVSPEFVLTWKHLATPSGRRICRLRASSRRTSGSGCTGWQAPQTADASGSPRNPADRIKQDRPTRDPTMLGNARLDLKDQCDLAAWATPTQRDGKDGACEHANVPINALLGRQVFLSPAVTESTAASPPGRMVLNPRFSLWLQGYPVAWASCGELAMRSSRKSERCSSERSSKRQRERRPRP